MFFLTAKAWHDSRNKSLSPTFSAGKALPKKTTPTKKATTSATKRRRTPTRKSTGGIGNSRSPSASSVAGSTPPRKSRRSVGSSAISAAKKFEFVPPVKEEKKDPLNAEEEEEEEEDVLSDSDATKELVEDLTTQSKSSTKKKVPIEPMQEDSETEDEDEEEEKEQSATKKKAKRQGGMAAIQKLREEREKKGLNVIHNTSSQKKSSFLAAATKSSQPASHTKQQQPKLKSPDPPSSNKPPAAVAALFSKPQPKKQSAHRPGQQKYDPNQPFPTSGYKLPTAAYCGCGPTPGSGNKMSSRGGGTGTGTETTSAPDPIDVNAAAATSTSSQRSGSFTAANMKQSMQHLPPVNHTTTTTATTTATPGMLSAAISKAQFLVQSAAGENRVRRAMMGIRGSTNVSGANTMTEEQMDDVNADALDDDNGKEEEERGSRKSLDPPTIDSSSVSYSATLQKFRGTGTTSVRRDTTTLSTTKGKPQKKEPEDATAATTVAGEHTSEAGEEKHKNDDDKSSTSIHLDEEMEKELSFVKKTGRVCFSIMKILMCIQLGVGFLFLVSYMLPSPSKSFLSSESQYGNVQTSTAEEKEFDCFIDYPQLNVEGYDTFDDDGEDDVCEGKYKQCPPWGRCSKGKLQDCLDGDDALYEGMVRFVVNDSGTECVISPEAKELSTLVHDAIVDMTVDQVCRGSFSATNDESYPLFSLYLVASRVKDPSTSEENDGLKSDILIWLRPVFDRSNFVRFGALSGDDEDDVDAMSLGEGMSPNSLPLPLSCKGKLYAWELLEIFCTSAWVLLAFAVKKSWFLLMTYPIYTVSAILMWQFIRLFRRRKKWNAKMKDARDTVFNLALDRLSECDHHDGWAAIMLRDDIAAYLHPTNWTERQFIIDDVWPGVRLLILADNRVRKFRKMANGRQLEHWDFAPQAKQVRKMRNSFSGSTPGSGVRNEDVSKTEQPLRRDP